MTGRHYREYAVAVQKEGKWVGEVRRRLEGPAQPMSGETLETLWCSEPCDTRETGNSEGQRADRARATVGLMRPLS